MNESPYIIVDGTENIKQTAELLECGMLVISTQLRGELHEFEVSDGKHQTKGTLAEALKPIDFRNLPVPGKWVFRGTLMGPDIQNNELDLLAPAFFVIQARNPEGIWLDFKEMLDACQRCGLDAELGYARVEADLLNLKTLRLLANESQLPGGTPAAGIYVRPETSPWLLVRFNNETKTKGQDNGKS